MRISIFCRCPASFHYAFVQRGLLEVLLLSVGAGLLGTWIVLRGLAFYLARRRHGGFPGLVLADGLGFSPPLGAFGAAALRSPSALAARARPRAASYDSLTALVLVGSLALGVILASDVFHSGANVETLLFGSLLADRDARARARRGRERRRRSRRPPLLGRRWLATGFDPSPRARSACARRSRTRCCSGRRRARRVAALAALGALLATALSSSRPRRRGSGRPPARLAARDVGLAAVEGVVGLWLSVEANVPPGRGDRRARRRRVRARRAGAHGCRGPPRSPPPRLRRCCSSRAAARAAATRTPSSSRRRRRSPTGPASSAATRSPSTRSSSRTPTRTSTSRGPPTCEADGRREGRARERRRPRRVDGQGRLAGRRQADGRRPRRARAGAAPGREVGPEASRFDPHWWHDPCNAMAAVRRIRTRSRTR